MTKTKGIIYSLIAIVIGFVLTLLSFSLLLIYFQPFATILGLGLMFFGFILLILYVFRY